MNARVLSLAMVGSLALAGGWGVHLSFRQAFLKDFNAGVHSYMTGNLDAARQHLLNASRQRAAGPEAKQLLLKILVDKSIETYKLKDYPTARQWIADALALTTPGDGVHQALRDLQSRITRPSETPPMSVERWLRDALENHAREISPGPSEIRFQKWLDQSQEERTQLLQLLSENQQIYLARLDHETSRFQKILWISAGVFCLLGIALLLGLLHLFRIVFGKRGILVRLMELQSHAQWGALGSGSAEALLTSGTEFRKIDAIEAELVNETDSDLAQKLLMTYLEGEDPWVRARAAKVLYKLNPKMALGELKALLADDSSQAPLSGVWALGELGNLEALDLLKPLAWGSNKEVQQATIRCLMQLENKKQASSEFREKVKQLLTELRSRTEWIL